MSSAFNPPEVVGQEWFDRLASSDDVKRRAIETYGARSGLLVERSRTVELAELFVAR